MWQPGLDGQGFIRSVVYAVKGNRVMEMFGFTAPELDRHELRSWTTAQVARL